MNNANGRPKSMPAKGSPTNSPGTSESLSLPYRQYVAGIVIMKETKIIVNLFKLCKSF